MGNCRNMPKDSLLTTAEVPSFRAECSVVEKSFTLDQLIIFKDSSATVGMTTNMFIALNLLQFVVHQVIIAIIKPE